MACESSGPNMNEKFLFTISIPTFNRAQYLDLCLGQICKQLPGNEALVELLVSDNHSEDATSDVVRKYIDQGSPVRYIKNNENIGGDRNFIQCFQQAKGKYVLLLGDDDVLLDGALNKIISVLKGGEYGIVFLKPYGFNENFNLERPKQTSKQCQTKVYKTINGFMAKVNYWVTFISGNIVNKGLVKNRTDFERFLDTDLNHLSWVFTAILNSEQNAFIEEFLIAMRIRISEFQFLKVFSANMNKIMEVFAGEGLPRKSIFIINNHLLFTFFPPFIVKIRSNSRTFSKKDIFKELHPVYKSYALFWVCLVPVINLPLPLAKAWLFFIRVINKLRKMIQR